MAQTLLLGLGGTGSRIVNYVASDLKKKKISFNDGSICCAVLDTNENDRKKISQTGVGVPIIPTSKNRLIKDYIKMYSKYGIDEWMPRSASLDEEGMKDGASQMRVKSRLAFMDTVEDNTIRRLEEEIDRMFDHRDGTKIRVMIVSSLAGGTGSGMFIQTALWLRKHFEKRKCAITIRGIFLLPDIFINTLEDIRDDDTEIQSLYANAYGAIRELNAITKVKVKGYVPPVPFKIGTLFDSDRDVNDGKPVYDYAFFIDDISEGGSVLTQIDHYEQVAARLVYMQLYAPMHDDLYSEEDNLFKRFQKSTEPVFGSCGTAKAVYPVEDVLNYCTLRSVSEAISTGWRKIDEEIKEKQRKEEESENSGKTLKRRISPREEYIRLFDSKSQKSGNQVGKEKLFQNIATDVKNEVRYPDEDGMAQTEYTDKVDDYIDLIEEEIALAVDTNSPGELSRIALKKNWLETSTETKETLLDTVKKKKKAVTSFIEKLDVDADQIAEELLDLVCPADMGDINAENQASILGLLTKKDNNEQTYFVHPVAVRYLLYKLSARLESIKDNSLLDAARFAAEKGHGNGRKEIIFDNPKTKTPEKDPESYLESKAFFQNKEKFIKGFMTLYKEFNNGQFELCRAYAIDYVKYKLAVLLSQRLEKLITSVDGFFRNLIKVSNTLKEALDENVRKNEAVSQKIVYVCASGAEKEAMYESLSINTGESNAEINAMIVRALYGQFCATESPDADNNEEYKNTNVETAFYREAISTYNKLILKNNKKDIDMDIYSAICKSSDFEYEAQMAEFEDDESDVLEINLETGESDEVDAKHARHIEAMETMVKKLYDLGAPFLISDDENPEDDADDSADDADGASPSMFTPIKKRKTFWGFNPVVADKCPELARILGVNVNSQSNKIYAKNELDCYRAVYGIQAGYVAKFNELKGGEYYKNYSQVVHDMIEGVAENRPEELVHTPHIDKTWHLILPYITPEKQQMDEEQFYRRFWLAVAYGMISVSNNGKFQIERKKKTSTGEYKHKELVLYNGEPISKVDVLELIASLRIDGAFMVEAAALEKRFKEECETLDNYEGTKFLRGSAAKEAFVKSSPDEDGKGQTGGLASKGDTNAVTLIVRYHNSKKHNTDVTATLIQYLEQLCYELVKSNYEAGEHNKIKHVSFGICKRIYDASAMKNKDIELIDHWKTAWSEN